VTHGKSTPPFKKSAFNFFEKDVSTKKCTNYFKRFDESDREELELRRRRISFQNTQRQTFDGRYDRRMDDLPKDPTTATTPPRPSIYRHDPYSTDSPFRELAPPSAYANDETSSGVNIEAEDVPPQYVSRISKTNDATPVRVRNDSLPRVDGEICPTANTPSLRADSKKDLPCLHGSLSRGLSRELTGGSRRTSSLRRTRTKSWSTSDTLQRHPRRDRSGQTWWSW